jgi:hypothetical protein
MKNGKVWLQSTMCRKGGEGLQNNNSVRITLTKSGYNPPSVVNKGRGLQNNNSVRITLTMT